MWSTSRTWPPRAWSRRSRDVGLPLLTRRLELRAFEPSDLRALHAVYGDPEVTRWTPRYPTLEHTRRALEKHIEMTRAGEPAFWAVIERASGELIGDAGVVPLEEVASGAELGYTLGRRWWGLGYATEAARACLKEAFGPLRCDLVAAVVRPENTASIHVLEKLGMKREGTRFAHGAEHLFYVTRRTPRRPPGGAPPPR
jgi:[ribosomal protein S5]-alanine N-acetyltransferase